MALHYCVKPARVRGSSSQECTPWTLENYRETAGIKIAVGVRGDDAFIQALEEAEVLLYHTDPPEGKQYT